MKKTLITIIAIAITFQISAQNTSGGTGNINSTQITWSVGEVAVKNYENSQTMLSQGIIQPYGIPFAVPSQSNARLASINEEKLKVEELSFQVYPNPVLEELTLEWPNRETDLHIRITDLSGKLIFSDLIRKEQQIPVLDLRHMIQGIYLLKVEGDGVIYQKTLIKK